MSAVKHKVMSYWTTFLCILPCLKPALIFLLYRGLLLLDEMTFYTICQV